MQQITFADNISRCVFFAGVLRVIDQGSTSFLDLLGFFCLVFVMPLCASLYLCLVVTCWERADLLALV